MSTAEDVQTGVQIGGAFADLAAKLVGLAVEAASSSNAQHADIVQRYQDAIAEAEGKIAALMPALGGNDADADEALRHKFHSPPNPPDAAPSPPAAAEHEAVVAGIGEPVDNLK